MNPLNTTVTSRLGRILLAVMASGYLLIGSISFAAEKTSSPTISNSPATILVTGANRGIGLALARYFHQHGFSVIATARKPNEALELKTIGVETLQLDITDPASIAALKSDLSGRPIDILLNNAGIKGHSAAALDDLDIEQLKTTFDVNSLGALRVIQALMPNLKIGTQKTVVNMSSRMGSIADNTGGAIGYRASKAALNNFNKSLSIEFSEQGFVFVVLHPGWVRTDMTSDRATYSTDESAEALFELITGLSQSDNGRFYDLHGESIAW
jgi:NAD(P)-dependent dehydrogenase (short-subunit alcohol dehydrogenase family)